MSLQTTLRLSDESLLDEGTRTRSLRGRCSGSASFASTLRAGTVTGRNSPKSCSSVVITSLWHQSGVPARELAERAGHARASMSLDVYGHVTPGVDVTSDCISTLIASSRVMHGCCTDARSPPQTRMNTRTVYLFV